MLKLGVNIDHVATIRQARYRDSKAGEPDPVEAALACERAGAFGITAHLREDRRHIQDHDIWRLKEAINIPLNFEMASTPEMIEIAIKLLPNSVCLVPEKREELTTEGGLDVAGNLFHVTEVTKRLQDLGIEVSLFIDPDPKQIDGSAQATAQAIELHTGPFAEASSEPSGDNQEVDRLIDVAKQGHELGIKVNAGHGLNYLNTHRMHEVPHLCELNIGHSIVSRAISTGMERAVTDMLKLLEPSDSQGSA